MAFKGKSFVSRVLVAAVVLVTHCVVSAAGLKDFKIAMAELSNSTKPKVLLLSNDDNDPYPESGQAKSYKGHFETAGADVVVLPVGLLAGLPKEKREALKKQILKTFTAVVALDGNDISPKIYGKYNTHARNVNPDRDAIEADILKAASGQHGIFVFGVGRGHHMIAAIHGLELFQDIQSFLKTEHDHAELDHEIGYFPTRNKLLVGMLPGFDQTLNVASRHHQSVRPAANTQLEVAAMSPDGVVEALEFKNGQGISVQFHPDKLPAEVAARFFKALVQQIGAVSNSSKSVKSCASLLSAS